MFALEFPPINEILRWTDVVPSVNKIALIAIAAVVVASVVFLLAGHILLVTFALLTEELVQGGSIALKPVGILPFFMLVFLTAFEVLVAFLQAYIFTILAAVYIGGAAHPEH